jgi:hypothetical protein
VAAREHEAQQIVADVVVERGVEVRRRRVALELEHVAELLVLAVDALPAAQLVERAVLRGGHEPRAGALGQARARPRLERRDERVLRELLGAADVAGEAREAGDEPGGLDAEDRVDRAGGGLLGHDAIGAPRRAAARIRAPRASRRQRDKSGLIEEPVSGASRRVLVREPG